MTEIKSAQTGLNTSLEEPQNSPETNFSKQHSRKHFKVIVFLVFLSILVIACCVGGLLSLFILKKNPYSCCLGLLGNTAPSGVSVPTVLPSLGTPTNVFFPTVTISPSSGTRTYTSSAGFSFQYPADLSISETKAFSESPISQNPGEYHKISISFEDTYSLNIVYKNVDNPVDMQTYGGAAGEFISRGNIYFFGQAVENFELVHNNGNNGYYYEKGGVIIRQDKAFAINLIPNEDYWEESVPIEILEVANRVLESFVFN